MYAADTEEAAIAETLLHDIPVEGGLLPYDQYATKVLVRLTVTQRLHVGVLHGTGLRRLKVTAAELTSSPAFSYATTVRWAEAAQARSPTSSVGRPAPYRWSSRRPAPSSRWAAPTST